VDDMGYEEAVKILDTVADLGRMIRDGSLSSGYVDWPQVRHRVRLALAALARLPKGA